MTLRGLDGVVTRSVVVVAGGGGLGHRGATHEEHARVRVQGARR